MPSSVPRQKGHRARRLPASQNSLAAGIPFTGIGLRAGTPIPGTASPAASTAAEPKGGHTGHTYIAQGGATDGSGVLGAARA